ncbi:hypothetical protein PsorP6_002640 [Peronosclerospora sorghi]|uniref:Uncharacterized protein n=1 Tax=Peronosclerospora sorghi TaxID=230839 RepID=A0ACC0WUV0_9STRA|nr:hypothetical protein PsorP6_002640 [Peronosclerospora sorghi]
MEYLGEDGNRIYTLKALACGIPIAGSTYAYEHHAVGELPAFFAGFLLTLDTCVVNLVTLTKVTVVLFIIVVVLWHVDPHNLVPFVPDAAVVVRQGHVTLAFGWSRVLVVEMREFLWIRTTECCLEGEAKAPRTNILHAVVGTVLGAAALSILSTLSLVGMQNYTHLDAAESYGTAFASVSLDWAASFVAKGEFVTMPITTFIGFLAQPRVQYCGGVKFEIENISIDNLTTTIAPSLPTFGGGTPRTTTRDLVRSSAASRRPVVIRTHLVRLFSVHLTLCNRWNGLVTHSVDRDRRLDRSGLEYRRPIWVGISGTKLFTPDTNRPKTLPRDNFQ